ncbi:sigma factor [Nocardia abscessus]|uniref:sigma factor n=1 Tax=Nocardia abscessus TaxID=120957 RepID=UPI001D138572|nr:sigma factor [Nocardia abscessus]MCC3333498.1 hypothetical protein [Nocardia abscessus]
MTSEQPSREPLDQAELARQFEEHRPYLRRLAYSTLGSLSDADDVVQEAWLRLQRQHEAGAAGEIDNLRAWLSTVTGRLALDHLGSARVRREQYVGEWLPEPREVTPGTTPPTGSPRTSGSPPRCWWCSSPCRRPSAPPSCSRTSSA